MSLSENRILIHCEKTGAELSLNDMKVLTKIDGLVKLDNLANPEINEMRKTIRFGSITIRYFSKLVVPADMTEYFGEVYVIVNQKPKLEQSTALLSAKGEEIFIGQQLIKMKDQLNSPGIYKFAEGEIFIVSESARETETRTERCEGCKNFYRSAGKKYTAEKILRSKIQTKKWGNQETIPAGFDLAISDCSFTNPQGTGYLFSTDKFFRDVKMCSNECAVDYCKKNEAIISYFDFMNHLKMRILCPYSITINRNLSNIYEYRSSAIGL